MSDEHERANDWTTGFKPLRVGDQVPPAPPKPKCAVEGCERVVYKSVVCRKHWAAIPIEVRMKRMMDAQLAQQTAKADTDLQILDMLGDL